MPCPRAVSITHWSTSGSLAASSFVSRLIDALPAGALHVAFDPGNLIVNGFSATTALESLASLSREQPAILVLHDFHRYADDGSVCRKLRNLAASLRQSPHTVVITAAEWQLPRELEECITLLDLPLPEQAEIQALLRSIAQACGQSLEPALLEQLSQCCSGLSEQRIRQVAARDGGCRFPGCNRPVRFCDAHHIRYWRHGGTTDYGNLVLLCSRHHHLVHQQQLVLTLEPEGELLVEWRTGSHRRSEPRGAPPRGVAA